MMVRSRQSSVAVQVCEQDSACKQGVRGSESPERVQSLRGLSGGYNDMCSERLVCSRSASR